MLSLAECCDVPSHTLWPAGASKATESACSTRASASNQAVMSFQLISAAISFDFELTSPPDWRQVGSHFGDTEALAVTPRISTTLVSEKWSNKRSQASGNMQQWFAMIKLRPKNVTTALSNCILADSQQPVHSVLRKKAAFHCRLALVPLRPVFGSGHWLWAEQLTFPTRWSWLTQVPHGSFQKYTCTTHTHKHKHKHTHTHTHRNQEGSRLGTWKNHLLFALVLVPSHSSCLVLFLWTRSFEQDLNPWPLS